MKLDHYFTPYVKINSKYINNLNIFKTTKLQDENIGVNLYDLVFGSGFIEMVQNGLSTNEKNRKIVFL